MGLKECEETFKEYGFCLCWDAMDYYRTHELPEILKDIKKE